VIDEACGMTLALFLVPYSITAVIIGFLMFRLLDIVKIFPAKQIEKVSGAFGVMFDDIIAALYTNIALQLITRVFCWF
jgi:phosphatidylglycerophosphatase A